MTPEERREQRRREAERQKQARAKRMNPPLTLHQLRRKSEEQEQKIKERYRKELEESQKEEAGLTRAAEAAEDDRLQSQVNKLYVGCVKEKEEKGIPIERALEICKKAYSPNVLGIASEAVGRKRRGALATATGGLECLKGYMYDAVTKTCEKISEAIDYARYGDGEHDNVQGAWEAFQHGINWDKGGGRTRRKRRRSKRKTKRKTIRKRNKRRRKTRKRRKVKRKRRRKSRR